MRARARARGAASLLCVDEILGVSEVRLYIVRQHLIFFAGEPGKTKKFYAKYDDIVIATDALSRCIDGKLTRTWITKSGVVWRYDNLPSTLDSGSDELALLEIAAIMELP